MSETAAQTDGKGASAIRDQPPGGALTRRELLGRMWWCVLAGVLIFTAFPFRTVPASNLWLFAWFGLVPLMLAVEDTTPRQAFWLGWLAGTVTNYGGFHWISGMLEDFGGFPSWLAQVGTVLLNAYQGLAVAIICSLWVRLRPTDEHGNPQSMSILRVAMIYTAVEFLFPMIFPWFFGNSQYRTLAAIQIADIVGVPGITFVMVAFNAALYRTLRRFTHEDRSTPWSAILVGVGLTVVTLGYGVVRLGQVTDDVAAADTLKIGLVEADIGIWSSERRANPTTPPIELRHSHLLRYHRLSQQLDREGVDLIIWPESSYQPQDRLYLKRRPDFVILATSEGQLAVWRDGRDPDDTRAGQADGGDAMKWTMVPTDGPLGELTAVASEREDAAAIVGAAGAAYFFDGKAAWRIPTSTEERLNGVDLALPRRIPPRTAYSSARIWAVGDNGLLLRGSRKRLDRVSSGTTNNLRAIALFNDDTGLAVGDEGTIVFINKGTPRAAASPTTEHLRAVWAAPPVTSRLYAFAVGDKGTVVRLDDPTLPLEQTPTRQSLRAVAGTDDGRLVVAVGDAGTAVVRDPSGRWRREQVGREDATLVAVTIDAMGRVVAADADGGLYLRRADAWSRLPSEGIVKPVALASLGWVRHIARLPRDVRYMRPSRAPLPPSDAAFFDDPQPEWGLMEWERAAVQRGHDTPVLFGGITSELRTPVDLNWPYRDWNTAVMVDRRGRVVGLYDKVYLLVGGEFIPFGEQFPVLYEWIRHAGRFEAGTEVKVFNWRGYRLGVMICYEDILPKFNRRLADLEPHVILNVTNDAWFGHTAEPYLHMALAIFRSVEQRRALVRSTNTGVSVFVSPTGEIIKQTEITGRETLSADVPMMTGKTIYGRIGDVFAWIQVGWLLALILPRMLAWRRRRRRGGSGTTKSDANKKRATNKSPARAEPPAPRRKSKSNTKRKRKR